jgi:hypothetical protein
MKTRIGFVSNSSSASYLVPLSAFNTVFDLAEQIIKIRDDDWAEIGSEGIRYNTKEKLLRAKDRAISPDTPVQFQTTNYPTWIKKTDKGFILETCNNHHELNMLMDQINAKYAEDHRELGIDEYEREPSSKFFSEQFYFLEIEKLGHKKYVKGPRGDTDARCSRTGDEGYRCNNAILVLNDGTETCTRCEGLEPLD